MNLDLKYTRRRAGVLTKRIKTSDKTYAPYSENDYRDLNRIFDKTFLLTITYFDVRGFHYKKLVKQKSSGRYFVKAEVVRYGRIFTVLKNAVIPNYTNNRIRIRKYTKFRLTYIGTRSRRPCQSVYPTVVDLRRHPKQYGGRSKPEVVMFRCACRQIPNPCICVFVFPGHRSTDR